MSLIAVAKDTSSVICNIEVSRGDSGDIRWQGAKRTNQRRDFCRLVGKKAQNQLRNGRPLSLNVSSAFFLPRLLQVLAGLASAIACAFW
jgi:hypothetical protein